MNTPTPRTDAAWRSCMFEEKAREFTRQLERELAAERALLDRLAEALKQYLCGYTHDSDRSLAAWKDQRRNKQPQTPKNDDKNGNPRL